MDHVNPEFINTDQDEEKDQYDGQEHDGYESDAGQSANEPNDGQYAKNQFYQVQKLHLKDTSGLDDFIDEPLQRLDVHNDQAYSGDF